MNKAAVRAAYVFFGFAVPVAAVLGYFNRESLKDQTLREAQKYLNEQATMTASVETLTPSATPTQTTPEGCHLNYDLGTNAAGPVNISIECPHPSGTPER